MFSGIVRYLFYDFINQWMKRFKKWNLHFPAKENPNMEKALFDWQIVLQYDVKAKYRLISRISRAWSFPAERSLNQPKSSARLYPFDKPIKSLYFRPFVSVLFARFHFKVVKKSLYPWKVP